jgi:hypothetical protein
MEQEATPAQETTVQPSDHVSVSNDGNIVLSPEAEAIMEGKEPEVKEPEKKEVEKETSPEPEKEPEKKEEKPKRKIKHNGAEVEIEPDKEEELLQKGFDYTQKTQALAAERDMITPYVGLVKAMQSDPALSKNIAALLKGDTKQEVPQFDDPIEQLKYETEQRTIERVKKELIEPLQHQTAQVTREQVIETVKTRVQADPLFKEVQTEIFNYISQLPDSIGRPLYNELNGNPQAYLEMFNKVRTKIADKKPKEQEKQQPEEELPEPVKRETHAPLLESADKTGGNVKSKEQSDKIKALIKRSRNGDFAATGELLELNALP